MKDQVKDLVPSIMHREENDGSIRFSLLRVAAFAGAVAIYLAALALAA